MERMITSELKESAEVKQTGEREMELKAGCGL